MNHFVIKTISQYAPQITIFIHIKKLGCRRESELFKYRRNEGFTECFTKKNRVRTIIKGSATPHPHRRMSLRVKIDEQHRTALGELTCEINRSGRLRGAPFAVTDDYGLQFFSFLGTMSLSCFKTFTYFLVQFLIRSKSILARIEFFVRQNEL